MASDFNSPVDPRADGDDREASDPGFGDPGVSFVDSAPALTASEAVVMPDPFEALELQAVEPPVASYVVEDLPDDGPPDPEADFYDLIL